MSIKKRLLLFFLITICQAIYLPLNRWLENGTVLKIPLDDLIPIQPIWAVPYVLWMVSWYILWFFATLKMPEALFKQLVVSSLVVILSAMVFFYAFPTYVPRRPVDDSAFGAIFLKLVYSADDLYCAFPSGHIYLCTLSALYFSRWHPRTTLVWIGIVALVAVSTLLTGQHFLVDIPGGLFFAFAGDLVGRKLVLPSFSTFFSSEREITSA